MSTLPPGGIVPSDRRDGLTDRQPPRPALTPTGDADPGPDVTARHWWTLLRHLLILAGLVAVYPTVHGSCLRAIEDAPDWVRLLGDAPLFWPVALAVQFQGNLILFLADLFPNVEIGASVVEGGIWAVYVYGMFLAIRWLYRRVTGRPRLPQGLSSGVEEEASP